MYHSCEAAEHGSFWQLALHLRMMRQKGDVASWDTNDHIWERSKENKDCAGFNLKCRFLCVWLPSNTHLWNQNCMPSEKGQFNLLMLLWNDRAWFDQHLYSAIELKKNEEYWKYVGFVDRQKRMSNGMEFQLMCVVCLESLSEL